MALPPITGMHLNNYTQQTKQGAVLILRQLPFFIFVTKISFAILSIVSYNYNDV